VLEGPSVGYPREYPFDLERLAVVADGREVLVRPIRPGDAAELREAIAEADYDTLYARFLGSPPHDEASIRRLVEVDYVHRLALVAFAADGTGVGIARYEGASGEDTAEVAVVVDARWRKVGLGSLLLRELGRAALRRGIRRFTAVTLADNTSVLSVLRSSGLAFSTRIDSGTTEIVMWLDDASPAPGQTTDT
jgi:GNAT superfamily N-acetyltransferase